MEYTSYLVHHGILGQKWGDRNGPPYPLNSSSHSSAERKAAKEDAKDAKAKAAYEKEKTKYEDAKRKEERSELKRQTAELKKSRKSIKSDMKLAKQKQEAAKKEAKRKRAFDKNREKIVNSGNIKEAAKYTDLFTTDELGKIIAKYEKATQVKSLASNKKKAGRDYVQSASKDLATISDFINNGVKLGKSVKSALEATGVIEKEQSPKSKKVTDIRKWKETDANGIEYERQRTTQIG